MIISKDDIRKLIKLITNTKETEIDCDQCLNMIAEFAETKLTGLPLSESLKLVEEHLLICAECCEEYELLKKTLSSMKSS